MTVPKHEYHDISTEGVSTRAMTFILKDYHDILLCVTYGEVHDPPLPPSHPGQRDPAAPAE